MNDEEYKGFLLVKQTYKVKCRACGFRGQAVLGKEPIQGMESGGEDWCPVCNSLALVADNMRRGMPAR